MKRWLTVARYVGALAAVLVILLLARCGQQSAYTPGTFTAVYNQTLKTACVECHQPGGSATIAGATLDFTTQAKAYATIKPGSVGGGSSGPSCKNLPIVVAGNATSSFLAAVLFVEYDTTPFQNPGCTPYATHQSDQNLSADEKSSLLQWINAGAKNN